MATVKDGKGTKALAMIQKGGRITPIEIGRPQPGPNDVRIKVLYCGMCHSDIHATNGDWGINMYPMAPGHEIAGVVVSSNSKRFKEGQRVGVGCMVESCQSCNLCEDGLEQHCPQMIQTYGSQFPAGKHHDDCAGYQTNGGYSDEIVVHDHFCFEIPEHLDMKFVGPLLCAGITTYSPLNRYVKGKKDQTVGVVGFGGLGMMTAKIALAMGARVVIFSRGTGKAEHAKKLGAELVSHQDTEKLQSMARTIDTMIDTVSSHHDIDDLVNTLKVGGTYVFLGAVGQPYPVSGFKLIFSRYSMSGSLIGGVSETKEMLEFCTKHNIMPEVEVVHANRVADIYEMMEKGNAPPHRHVIDMATLPEVFGTAHAQ